MHQTPDERIDYSQWLPRDADLLNEWRRRHGDIAETAGGRGGREIRSFAHPLDFYLRRDGRPFFWPEAEV